jgi:hypothetical protein
MINKQREFSGSTLNMTKFRLQAIDTVPLVQINISLLAGNVGITTTNTLDGSQSNHNLVLTINVGVEETQNVLKL